VLKRERKGKGQNKNTRGRMEGKRGLRGVKCGRVGNMKNTGPLYS